MNIQRTIIFLLMVISCANNAAENSTLDPVALSEFITAYRLKIYRGLQQWDAHIEEIHEKYAKSYDDKVLAKEWWALQPLTAFYRPLDLALQDGRDSVVEHLLNEKKVSMCYRSPDNHSPIHFWVRGMVEDRSEGREGFLKQLCEGGAEINAIHNGLKTPLYEALERLVTRVNSPFKIVPLLFRHGACLTVHEDGKKTNALFALDPIRAGNLDMMVDVLSARAHPLEKIRKNAEFCCLLFYRINQSRKGTSKIPRVLRDYIIDFVIPCYKKRLEEGIPDICESVTARGLNGKSFPTKRLRKKALIRVVQSRFWKDRSFRQAAQALDAIITMDWEKVTVEQINACMPEDLKLFN